MPRIPAGPTIPINRSSMKEFRYLSVAPGNAYKALPRSIVFFSSSNFQNSRSMARRLLPNANPPDYTSLVNASIASEGLVNGLWFSFLNPRFPTDAVAWSISPEVRTPAGDFIDLFITLNTYNPYAAHPNVIYEGKQNQGDTWDNILTQVNRYAQTYATQNGQFIYMIGAMGSGCRFFRYKRGDAIPTTFMAYDPRNNLITYKDSGLAVTSDILIDQTAICYLIDEILAHPTNL